MHTPNTLSSAQPAIPTISAAVPEDLSGTVILQDCFQLSQLLRHDSHCSVYAVLVGTEVKPSEVVEARVYEMGGINKKLAKYRQRSMGRLVNRLVWNGQVREKFLFVYFKDADNKGKEKGEGKKADFLSVADSIQESENAATKSAKREAARLKQQRRRARKQERKLQKCGEEKNDSPPETANPALHERMMVVLTNLHAIQRLQESTQLPITPSGGSHHPDLPPYLKDDPLSGLRVSTAEELNLLINSKRGEAEFFNKLLYMIPKLRAKKLQEYISLCTSTGLESESAEDLEAESKQALENLEMLGRVAPFIESLSSKAEFSHAKLSKQKSLVNQALKVWNGLEIDDERTLEMKRKTLETLESVLVPLTAPHSRIQAELELVHLTLYKKGASSTKLSEHDSPVKFLGLELNEFGLAHTW